MGITTAQSDAIKVLQTPLASLTTVSADNIIYVNKAYTPTEGTPFLQAFAFFSEPTQASLGTSGLNRLDGYMQIDVNVPVNEGRTSVNPILAELRGIYKRGTTLTNADISVKCVTVWESSPFAGDGWYVVPIQVRWYAYTTND